MVTKKKTKVEIANEEPPQLTEYGSVDVCCVPRCKEIPDVGYTLSARPGSKWWFCSSHHAQLLPKVLEDNPSYSKDLKAVNALRSKIHMPLVKEERVTPLKDPLKDLFNVK